MRPTSAYLVILLLCGRAASAQEMPPRPTFERAKTKHVWSNPTGLTIPDNLRLEQKWQGKAHCGVNALYAMLLMKGIPVDLDEISSKIELPEGGASLEQLRELAGRYNLATEVVKTTPDRLKSLPMPLIMHQAMSEKGKSDRDHFVLVVGLDTGGRYAVIDGTTGLLSYNQPESLEPMWSGYALITTSAMQASVVRLALKTALGVMLALIIASQAYLVWLRWTAEKAKATAL